jgi:hypothetical protein
LKDRARGHDGEDQSAKNGAQNLDAREARAARGVRAFDEEFKGHDVPRPEFWAAIASRRFDSIRFESGNIMKTD